MAHDVHGWFELSYAQYLTIPRSVMQSMPLEWQRRMVQCLEELDDTIDWRPENGRYYCELRDYQEHPIGPENDEGEQEWCNNCYTILNDPLQDYQRGRRQIPHRKLETDNG